MTMPSLKTKIMSHELRLGWLWVALVSSSVIIYFLLAPRYSAQWQPPLPLEQREMIKTLLYSVAIISLPMTNLMRHVLLRLNATMPFSKKALHIVAKRRYALTVLLTMAMIESIAVYGFVMVMIGESFNNFYIFESIALLGIYLHRPKMVEYQQIIENLELKHE